MDLSTPRLVYSPHPLLAHADRRLIATEFLPGESVADYLARVGVPLDAPCHLALNDRLLPRAEWARVCPQPGDLLTVRAAVHGGKGSDPLRTILTIAVIVASGQYGAAVGGTLGIGQAAGQAVILVGGSLLINTLLPPPIPELRGGDRAESPTYALSGGSNRARPFEPLPLILGQHRVYPDLGANSYTEFVGEDQYLYQVFNFGLSDVVLSNFKIGDTPLANFDGVETQESGADGALTLFPANVDTLAGGALTAAADWITRTSSLNATRLAVDVTGYLFLINNKGKIRSHSVVIEIEYRAVGAGTWLAFVSGYTPLYPYWQASAAQSIDDAILPTTHNGHYYVCIGAGTTGATEPTWPTGAGSTINDGTVAWQEAGAVDGPSAVTIESSSRKPLRRGWSLAVARGQYEVRMRRTTADETDPKKTSDLAWNQLRTYQPDDAGYTGQKRVALRIKASGQLQGQVEQFNALATARCEAWNGSSWVAASSTRNPAWWFRWFALGKSLGGRPAFGAGLTDAGLDLAAIKLWGAFCDSKGLTFDGVFDRALNGAEALTLIARCGRASPTRSSGNLGAIWDAAAQPAVAVFGMSNIRRGTFNVEYLTGRLADEIVLTFVNPDLGWQQDTVRATVPGVASPVRQAQVQLFGCASKAMAGAEANLLAAQQAYRRRRVSWETDMEGLVVNRGDVVTLSHDLTQWGYSGRLLAGTTTVLTLDRTVPFTPAQSHYCGVRFPDGSYAIYPVQYQAGESAAITLTSPLPAAPDDDPDHPPLDYLWFFEPKATPGKKVKLISIQPLSEHHVRLVATDEDDAYYSAESGAYTYVPPATYGVQTPTISNLTVSDTLIQAGAGFTTRVALAWEVTGPYGGALIRVAPSGEPLALLGQTDARAFEFTWDAEGSIDIQVTAASPVGQVGASGRATVSAYPILGKSAPPSDITGLAFDGVFLTWLPIEDVDRKGYRVRYRTSGTDWATATPAHGNDYITDARLDTTAIVGGTVKYLVKALDTSEHESTNAAALDVDLRPATPTSFLITRQPDGTREFTWSHASPPADLAGARIRYYLGSTSDWAAMTALHQGLLLASPFESNLLAAGTYTFAVKYVDLAGNESASAAFITTSIGDPRIAGAIEDINEAPSWTATKTSCHVDAATGWLVADGTGTWSSLPATWAGWSEWNTAPVSPLVYQREIDLGVIVGFVPLVSVTADGTATVEEQHSDNGSSWSSWAVAGPLVTARYIRVRATVAGAYPKLKTMRITLSASPITEVIEDLDTSTLTGSYRIGVGDIRLPKTKSYAVIRKVGLTLQSVGAGWSWELIDKDTSVGPRVKIYNASNALADAVIDADILGL